MVSLDNGIKRSLIDFGTNCAISVADHPASRMTSNLRRSDAVKHGQPLDGAGRRIRGDRCFDYKDNYQGQITFLAWEVYRDLCCQLDVKEKSPGVFQRNVVTRGLDC